jgi:hypothetical protein
MNSIGRHNDILVMIPYEETENQDEKLIMPVTVHATSRQQIKFRLNSGRFVK